MQVVQLNDYRPPAPKKVKQKSFYELYPMPFFNRKKRCSWDVIPSGDYSADCETGRAFAIEFLKSCDGTCGWASLMGVITRDMIKADDRSGIVIGFMRVVGSALVHSRVLD
jgi:hypothetical protein